MPGYTMHLAEAAQLLPTLEKHFPVDETWRNRFLIGTLLPDTKIRGDKKVSHFWAEEDLSKMARAPRLDLFLKRYGNRLSEPCILGYYAHLYLDEGYVKHFWPTMFTFLNQEGREAEEIADIVQVLVKKSGERVPLNRFYTVDYYYGDYNRMNKYFFDRYPIEVPVWEEGFDPGMEEVQISHMHRVLGEMEQLVRSLDTPVAGEVKVFPVEEFDRFIQRNGEEFLTQFLA